MAKFHFFIDETKLQQQSNIQKFGPVDAENYRTTSQFNLSGEAQAFAISTSKLIVVDNDSDPNLINVILMPIHKNQIGLNPNLRYVIYRGLKRSDFMTPDAQSPTGYKILDAATVAASGTDFLQSHYDKLTQPINNILPSLNDFSYKSFTNPSDLLLNICNHKDQLAIVDGGMYFGNFASGSAGIDFVVDEHKYILDLSFAESNDHSLAITGFNSGVGPGQESYDILARREYIHNFIDPAAYYNLHRASGVFYSGSSTPIFGDDIYNNLLINFATKNTIYVDLRNNNDYSLNYYRDNQNATLENLKLRTNVITTGNTGFVNQSYYTTYWPILILEGVAPNTGYNFNFFDLVFFTEFNPEPYLYYDYAFTPYTGVEYNSNTEISKFSLPIENGQRLKKLSLSVIDPETLYERIVVPCLTNGQDSIAWFVRLYVLRNKNPDPGTLPIQVVQSNSEFDNLFGNILNSSAGNFSFPYDFTLTKFKSIWQTGLSKKFIPSQSEPLMAQTGVGISSNDVTFFALPLDKALYQFDLIKGNKYLPNAKGEPISSFTTGTSKFPEVKQAIANKMDWEYFKKELTNGDSILAIDQGYNYNNSVGNTETDFLYSLNLTTDEYLAIQGAVLSGFNTLYHKVNFGFDTLNNNEDDGYWYGDARVKLVGLDNNGEFKEKTDISQTGGNLFVNTDDGKTYCSIQTAALTNVNVKIKESNAQSIFQYTNLIDYVKEIERINPESPEKTIARLSNYYYGFYSNRADLFESIALDRAVPHADDKGYTWDGLFVYNSIDGIDKNVKDVLTSNADENSIADNPSPYFIDPLGKKIDLGHLLYGLEGLIFDYVDTGYNYKNFQITKSNDLTGYVADVFTAAAERRIFNHYGLNKLGAGKYYYPNSDDPDRFYEISAPEADILSDVDPFGLFNALKYFNTGTNFSDYKQNNNLSQQIPLTFSFILSYYYDFNYDAQNFPLKYPIDANYQKRWLNFCRGFDGSGEVIQNPSSAPSSLVYQGFVEWNNTLSKYEWAADDITHVSVERLRARGEAFAHFWYQKCFSTAGTTIVLITSFWLFLAALQEGTQDYKVRFERNGQLSITGDLSSQIGTDTDPTELEYVMFKFLQFVKVNFQNEI